MTADPGRSGGEGTGNPFAGCEWGCTEDHRCSFHRIVHLDLSCDWCGQEEPHEGRCPSKPIPTHFLLDPVTARDTIARAICQAEDDYDELIEAQMPRPDRREDFLADEILAALASQERGE